MATIEKIFLSGSAYGAPIPITATSGTGTAIHTTATGSNIIDEVWLYATNVSDNASTLTLQIDGTANSDTVVYGIPSKQGLSVLMPGLILGGQGSTGSTLKAIANISGSVNIIGYVNRETL